MYEKRKKCHNMSISSKRVSVDFCNNILGYKLSKVELAVSPLKPGLWSFVFFILTPAYYSSIYKCKAPSIKV